jgi:hypothetical protein
MAAPWLSAVFTDVPKLKKVAGRAQCDLQLYRLFKRLVVTAFAIITVDDYDFVGISR